VRGRLLREERGFTLTEVMVTTLIMSIVLFALYSIFDMSLRVVGYGNAAVEATDEARLGLAKMERELRAAYPYNRTNGNTTLLTNYNAQQVTFGNDRNGNRRIVDAMGVADANEQITYTLGGVSPPYTLLRNSQPVVDHVQSLTLTYETRDGAAPLGESAIGLVNINLVIQVPKGTLGTQTPVTRTITTDVALRNRGD
jgi:prepilin-type N-terminal cleavage/methylation domain-containing protein